MIVVDYYLFSLLRALPMLHLSLQLQLHHIRTGELPAGFCRYMYHFLKLNHSTRFRPPDAW
nr:MAG TPA: hypothetical protein [Caudoviricetes sp.]